MTKTHTLTEQIAELAGARQLAYASLAHRDSTPETRARARRLLADIRSQRMALHSRLMLEQSATWREAVR